jgi:hypothetical protein
MIQFHLDISLKHRPLAPAQAFFVSQEQWKAATGLGRSHRPRGPRHPQLPTQSAESLSYEPGWYPFAGLQTFFFCRTRRTAATELTSKLISSLPLMQVAAATLAATSQSVASNWRLNDI